MVQLIRLLFLHPRVQVPRLCIDGILLRWRKWQLGPFIERRCPLVERGCPPVYRGCPPIDRGCPLLFFGNLRSSRRGRIWGLLGRNGFREEEFFVACRGEWVLGEVVYQADEGRKLLGALDDAHLAMLLLQLDVIDVLAINPEENKTKTLI